MNQNKKPISFIIILPTLFFLFSCATLKGPTQLEDGWKTAPPSEMGLNPSKLNCLSSHIEDLQAYNLKLRKYYGIDSVVVVKDDHIVYENYFNGAIRSKQTNLRSAGKSYISALFGIAMKESDAIKDPEQCIYDFLPYENYLNWTSDKQHIKIKHVLTMTAGWDCQFNNECSAIMEKQLDPFKWLLDLPLVASPGVKFQYTDIVPRFMSVLIEQSVQQNIGDYAKEKLLTPLGIKSDPFTNGITTREMAKFGQLFLNKGKWGNLQLIPASWVIDSTQVHYTFQKENEFANGYGYLWRIKDFQTKTGTYPAYFAAGNGGQYIYVIPNSKMVVAFTGHNYGKQTASEQLHELMEKYILTSIII